MPPGGFARELERIGRMITGWRVQIVTWICAAIILAILWCFALSDIYLQYRKLGRIAIWLLLVGLIVLAFKRIGKTGLKKHTMMGVAAMVELAFPELDNHLINFLQFSNDKSKDPFKKMYVKRGVPEWSGIKLREMKNKKAHLRANLALVLAIVMFFVPVTFTGKAWAVAVMRMINPFSNLEPISLTNIIEVDPGDTSAIQGSPLVLAVKIAGKSGHKVQLDINPSDNEQTTYSLGNVQGKGEEKFSYRIVKVTTDIKYRFRAGDAPFPKWYTIKARAPLAMNSIDMTVKPPAYQGADTQQYDGLNDEVFIPQGSAVNVTIKCNAALKSATLEAKGKEPIALKKGADSTIWTGSLKVTAGATLKFTAVDAYDEDLVNAVNYTLLADKPPIVEVLAPRGRTLLPPGTAPEIEFAVVDDYGIANIIVEKIAAGSSKKSEGKVVQTWKIKSAKDFTKIWKGENQKSRGNEALSFRIVATDNYPDSPHTAKSATVSFNATSVAQAEKIKDSMRGKVSVALSKVVNLQKANISKTKKYEKALDIAKAEQWQELSATQTEIRELTKKILRNPLRPLGPLTDSVKKLYMEEMALVIGEINRIDSSAEGDKALQVTKSLGMEERILRTLTYADTAADATKVTQKVSLLSGLLSAIIRGEKSVIGKTETAIKNKSNVSSVTVDRQDDLAADITEFITACKAECKLIEHNEPKLAAAFLKAGTDCQDKKIREDMVLAAEKLDEDETTKALTHEQSALAKLTDISAALDEQKANEDELAAEEMIDVLETFGNKMSKMARLVQDAQEAMALIKANPNADNKELDAMEEEYDDIMKKVEQAMLQVPTDLHIFTELNAVNDIVEDVINIFQEIEQIEGSEDNKKDDKFHEEAYHKDEALAIIEGMLEAKERSDDMEQWLGEEPETVKVTQEAMDQEEMGEEGVSMGPLKAATEDLIGELLEETDTPEGDEDEAQDGASNKSQSDVDAGGPVSEGDIVSFAAKGKSGNEKPDHKEQDGRSNVGRQGMSNGECAAGSGTIGEGDDDIEARRTQDPTQSGKVDVDGEADTKATGGGKSGSGKADGMGDGIGGTQRMDSDMAGGSLEGMDGLMAKVERMYDQANAKDVKAPSIKKAAHHIRQARDAIADARPIEEVKELKKKAVAALRRAQTELGAGTSGALDSGGESSMLEDQVEGGSDEAPQQYRDLVNEYYKNLNDEI